MSFRLGKCDGCGEAKPMRELYRVKRRLPIQGLDVIREFHLCRRCYMGWSGRDEGYPSAM